MRHLCYALKMLWKERSRLSQYLKDPALQLSALTALPLTQLKNKGTKGIILDFDGVLGGHGTVALSPVIEAWLADCLSVFGSNRVFILSNQATQIRQQYFARYFPGVQFHIASQKKPHPEGILEILQASSLQPFEIVMVDDRLATGILAAVLADVQSLWITRPYITWRIHPLKEAFFYTLRLLERLLLKSC